MYFFCFFSFVIMRLSNLLGFAQYRTHSSTRHHFEAELLSHSLGACSLHLTSTPYPLTVPPPPPHLVQCTLVLARIPRNDFAIRLS